MKLTRKLLIAAPLLTTAVSPMVVASCGSSAEYTAGWQSDCLATQKFNMTKLAQYTINIDCAAIPISQTMPTGFILVYYYSNDSYSEYGTEFCNTWTIYKNNKLIYPTEDYNIVYVEKDDIKSSKYQYIQLKKQAVLTDTFKIVIQAAESVSNAKLKTIGGTL